MPNSLRARLKNLVHKGILTQKDLDRIVIMPVDEAEENKKSIQASEYETWGKACDEEYEELDFVQQHKKIGVNLVPCTDAISRSEAIRIASGYCHWSNIPDELAKLPSVTPAQNVCEDAISRQAVIDAIEKNAYRHTYLDQIIDIVSELPSVTPKHCEDAISREWLKTAIHNFYYGLKHIPTEEDIQAYIDAAPSVSTEKTGHWIPDKHPLASPHCSICNGYGYKTDAYCRACGAKMQEETETCKGCPNICIMYDQNMKGCKDKTEGVEE